MAIDGSTAHSSRSPGLAILEVHPGGVISATVSGMADVATREPVRLDSVFHLSSLAKVVTATAVLRLVQDGRMRLDADVRDYLRLRLSPPAQGVAPTLRQLLNHTGGIADPEGVFETPGTTAPDLTDLLDPGHGQEAITVSEVPGLAFRHSHAGYCVLQRVIEVACGLPFPLAVHRLVSEPVRLTSTAFWSGEAPEEVTDPSLRRVMSNLVADAASGHQPDGQRVVGGQQHYPGLAALGLWSSAGDLGVLLADLVTSWSGRDGLVLDARSGSLMLEDLEEDGAGLGVFLIPGRGAPCVLSQGWGAGFQSQLRAYPDRGGALAVLTNRDPGVGHADSIVGATARRIVHSAGWAA